MLCFFILHVLEFEEQGAFSSYSQPRATFNSDFDFNILKRASSRETGIELKKRNIFYFCLSKCLVIKDLKKQQKLPTRSVLLNIFKLIKLLVVMRFAEKLKNKIYTFF